LFQSKEREEEWTSAGGGKVGWEGGKLNQAGYSSLVIILQKLYHERLYGRSFFDKHLWMENIFFRSVLLIDLKHG
jgi:hypothetical protein